MMVIVATPFAVVVRDFQLSSTERRAVAHDDYEFAPHFIREGTHRTRHSLSTEPDVPEGCLEDSREPI